MEGLGEAGDARKKVIFPGAYRPFRWALVDVCLSIRRGYSLGW